MTALQFALAEPEDLQICADIVGGTDLYARYGRDAAAALTALQGAHTDPNAEVLVAHQRNRIVGFAWMALRGAFDRSPYLRLIAVAESQRGQRCGEQIIGELERRYADPSGLFLLVSGFNQGAQRFYQRLGYRHIGTIESYVAAGIDELIYFKAFSG